MALKAQTLFLYGFEVTTRNRSVDFKTTLGGPERLATLTLGFYNLSQLLAEIVRAMKAADPAYVYTASVNRNFGGGTENRVTIASTGPGFQLLFSSGTRSASSVRSLIGFPASDLTGLSAYTGTSTAGRSLVTELAPYNYLGPEQLREIQGSRTISASGVKESIVYQVMKFIQFNVRHEPRVKVETDWVPLIDWMIAQQPLEITPEVSSPNNFYEVTLESSARSSQGLGFTMSEQLPSRPDTFQTGQMVFRQIVSTGQFII